MDNYISLDYMEIQKKRFKELLRSQKGVSNALLTETDLIYKVGLKNGQRVYDKINLNDKNDQVYPERRLMDGHIFLPLYVAYFLSEVAVGNQTIFGANHPWHTSPDANVFTDTDGTVVNHESLRSIYYGGNFSIEIDGSKVVKEVSGHHMLYVPERPWQSAAASGEANPVPQQFGPGLDLKAYHRFGNEVVWEGGKDQKLIVSLGEGNVNNLVGGNVDATIQTELFVAFFGLHWSGETQKAGFCALR